MRSIKAQQRHKYKIYYYHMEMNNNARRIEEKNMFSQIVVGMATNHNCVIAKHLLRILTSSKTDSKTRFVWPKGGADSSLLSPHVSIHLIERIIDHPHEELQNCCLLDTLGTSNE